MTHFVSGLWPPRYGPVATISTTVNPALFLAVGQSPYDGANEGSDLLTYSVPAGGAGGGDGTGTGLYMAVASLHVDTVSNAGTTQTLETNVTYND